MPKQRKTNVNVLIQNILQLGVDIYLYLDANKLIAKDVKVFYVSMEFGGFVHNALFVGVAVHIVVEVNF